MTKSPIPNPKDHASPAKRGMLLVGHGTRDKRGVAEFLETAQTIAERVPDVDVEPGFLELSEPSIAQALGHLVARHARDIIVVPLFLLAADHVKRDIPHAVASAAARFPHLKTRFAEPLGCHPQILAASTAKFLDALGQASMCPEGDAALVMLARGTSDATAIADMRRFVDLRCQLTPVAEVRVGFMAVAHPSVDELLDTAGLPDCKTIVVQPHLLFHGKVFLDLQKKVAVAEAAMTGKRFLLAGYIGPCTQVATAAIDRFREAQKSSLDASFPLECPNSRHRSN